MRTQRRKHRVVISVLVIYSVIVTALCFSRSNNIENTFVPVSSQDIIRHERIVYVTDVDTEYGKIKKGTVVIITDTQNVYHLGNNLVIRK